MYLTVVYTSAGKITSVYKNSTPDKGTKHEALSGESTAIVMKTIASNPPQSSSDIIHNFKVSDEPKRGFVVITRVNNV